MVSKTEDEFFHRSKTANSCLLPGLSHGRRYQITLDPVNAVGVVLTDKSDVIADVKTHTS